MEEKKGRISGEKAWEALGVRMTSEEAKELKALTDRLKNGEVLSIQEEKRLEFLKKKQKTVTHIE